MAWIILIGSAIFEAVWATALGRSDGLTILTPTIIFIIGSIVSMAGLGYAMKRIPIGTAYSVWVGIGAALTVIYAVITGVEVMSLWKAVFLLGIIAAVIGLKLVSGDEKKESAEDPVDLKSV